MHVKIHVLDLTQNPDNPPECIHFAPDVFVAIVGKSELSQQVVKNLQPECFNHVSTKAEFMLFSQNLLAAPLFTRLVLLLLCALVSLANVLKLVASSSYISNTQKRLLRKTPIGHFSHS